MNSHKFLFLCIKTITIAFLINFLINSCTTIANDDDDDSNENPICNVISPINYSTFVVGDTITISVSADDIDGNINSVRFELDNIEVSNFTNPPYEYSFIADSSVFALGLHSISTIAIDNEDTESLNDLTYFFLNSSSISEAFIVINEISYNPPFDFFSGDWVELYNNGEEAVNISGWNFRDADPTHNFIFPDSSIIMPDSFLVIVNDLEKFNSAFPNVTNYISEEEFDFNLSENGEMISLLNVDNNVIDILEYNDVSPWPIEPDGTGPSLELLNPSYSNSIGSNWAASIDCYGTPGEENSVYILEND